MNLVVDLMVLGNLYSFYCSRIELMVWNVIGRDEKMKENGLLDDMSDDFEEKTFK